MYDTNSDTAVELEALLEENPDLDAAVVDVVAAHGFITDKSRQIKEQLDQIPETVLELALDAAKSMPGMALGAAGEIVSEIFSAFGEFIEPPDRQNYRKVIYYKRR